MSEEKYFVERELERKFLWFAEYNDGKTVEEYSDDEFKLFSELDQTNLLKFGFFGMGIRIWLNLNDGRFYNTTIDDKTEYWYDFCFRKVAYRDNKITFLSTFDKYNYKLIQLKHFVSDFGSNGELSASGTDQYIFGYKSKVNNIETECRCILDLSMIKLNMYHDYKFVFSDNTKDAYDLIANYYPTSSRLLKTFDTIHETVFKGRISFS